VSGFIAAPLTRLTGSVLKTRRLLAYVGFSGASLMLVVSTRMHNPLPAMIAMGLASFSNDLVMPGSWGACMDVGGKYAGTLSGAMNMMGNLGGAASPTVIGYMLRWTNNNWDMTFYVSAATYAMAVSCGVSSTRYSAGNLYGTAQEGGASNEGIAFKLNNTGETVLHSFAGVPDGSGPAAGLIRDSAGNLYGTTYGGGAIGWGTVFQDRCDGHGDGAV
jgi:uncharacterized repeat protein (TIGR03803 family)